MIVAVAAILRFATLDRQSFWFDEAFTAMLVRLPLDEMLAEIPDTESAPPLYYLLAWAWSRAFGTSEVGLRSLSALLGTATEPLMYVAGRTLISRRAGLVTAALVAASPFIVWYSQEARSYALLLFLSALSLAGFAQALRDPRRGNVLVWALSCCLPRGRTTLRRSCPPVRQRSSSRRTRARAAPPCGLASDWFDLRRRALR